MSTETDGGVKIRKTGILRVETGAHPRRSSAVSITEPTSPQPSVDRLSVSFANDDKKVDNASLIRTSITENEEEAEERGRLFGGVEANGGEEEDEYSASANVILERREERRGGRGSSRRRREGRLGAADRRRSSVLGGLSPVLSGRRRSSVFTSSSETGLSVEDATNQNLRIHKEVLAQVKYQPWPIRRKLRLVRQAKAYIKLHEGQIQERLAQKKSTKDILAHSKIVFVNYWNYVMRELRNIINSLSPWESSIKEIESHFGSAVASYFKFHRWLFSVNLKISIALLLLVILPEVLFANQSPEFAGDRKCMLEEEAVKSKKFLTLWNFEGILKHSPIFYGYYNSKSSEKDSFENKLPLIYFVTGLGLYVYSFVAILRKMAKNSRNSKLTEKDEYCTFTWKIFTSWDFMIGNPETAHNRISSIVMGFKEALLEEAEKTREDKRDWKLLSLRILSHSVVICLLASSVWLVIIVVLRSQIAAASDALTDTPSGWWRQNELTIVITLIGMVYPVLFESVGLIEKYHPRKALRMQLARIMVLNLLNLYALIITTFTSVHNLLTQSCENMPNMTVIKTFEGKRENNSSKGNVTSKGFAAPLIAVGLLLSSPTKQTQRLHSLYDPSQENTVFSSNYHSFSTTFNMKPDNVPYSHNPKDEWSTNDVIGLPGAKMIVKNFTLELNDQNNFGETEKPFIYDIIDYNEAYPALDYPHDFSTSEIPIQEENDLAVNTSETSRISYSTKQYEDGFSTENDSLPTNIPIRGFDNISVHFPSLMPLGDNETTQDTDDSYTEPTSLFNGSTYDYEGDNMSSTTDGYSSLVNSTLLPNSDNSSTTDDWGLFIPETPPDPQKMVCKQRTLNLDYSPYVRYLKLEDRRKVHSQCWETMFGQELVKLTVMDLVMTVATILLVDFFRAVFVRYMNKCWFWDLEKKFPQYGDFKIAENILQLVNNQGMVWMGMFFSPGLPLINVIKLVVLMHLRSWAVLTCNVPHEVVFRASKSNNFYFGLLLTMLFLCVLPVSYALVWIDTSWHCGPFSKYNRIYSLFTNSMPKAVQVFLSYIASPGMVIPLLVLLILIIFYQISLTSALREANDDLKLQLRTERTEERRKVFQMANKKKKGSDNFESPFNKWYNAINSAKNSLDMTPSLAASQLAQKQNKTTASKDPEDGVERSADRVLKGTEAKVHPSHDRKPTDTEFFRDREDSIISGSSTDKDNIPEIKISQSESSPDSPSLITDTYTPSKSSSKDTIINLGEDKVQNASSLDDVFLEDETTQKKIKKPELDFIDNEDSTADEESYASISKSLSEMNNIGTKALPESNDPLNETRKTLANILVKSLSKK